MHRSRTRRAAVSLAAVAALVLTACGSAGDQAGGADDGTGDDGQGGDAALTLSHDLGELELAEPAEDVVALEWTYAEDLLALGVEPVGVADLDGYDQWVSAGPRLDDSVTDVGTRQEPSLETLRVLDPDLIITSRIRSEANYDDLAAIAPTLMFDPYADASEYEEMRGTLHTIGTAVGREDAATDALDELDEAIDDARRRIADADADGTAVTVARGYTTDGADVVELLTDTTIPGALLDDLGLTNAWTGDADAYGMSKVDVETLKQVEDSVFVYVAAEDDDVFADSLAGNALWQDLGFVRDDEVHALDPGTWFYGGPFCTAQVATEIADAVTS